MRLSSLRARLFAAIAVVALLSLALALAIGAVLTRRAVERNTLRDVSAQFDLLVERERNAVLPFSQLRSLQEFLDRQDQQVERVPLDGSSPLLPPERAAELRRGVKLDGALESDGTRYLYAARLVSGKGFMLLRPASSTNSAWRPHVQGLIVAAVATAALAALIAFLLARAIARPVKRVAEATRKLASSTELPPLVPVEGPRELAQLAESFNEVAVALAKAREAERAFLLSVSHELKTPLTAIRGYAEGLQEGALPADEAASTIVAESRRLERLVGDLLDLARMNKAEFSVRREPIDLAAIGQEALRRYEGQARDFDVTLELDGPAGGAGDRRRRPRAPDRLEPRRERPPPDPGGRPGPHRRRPGRASSRGHRARIGGRRPRARLRALLPLLAVRPRAARRHRARARDREGARDRHGRLRRGFERPWAADRLHGAAPAAGWRHAEPRLSGFTRVLRSANGRLTAPGKDAVVSFARRRIQMKNAKYLLGALAVLATLALATTAVAAVVIKGTNKDDVLTGTDRNDLIIAKKGNDTVNGLAGNDRVHGNGDNDTLNGDAGNDRLWGGCGNDSLAGGADNDVLRGRPGDDALDGGPGNDRMWPGRGADTQQGGDGDDVLHALARDKQVDTDRLRSRQRRRLAEREGDDGRARQLRDREVRHGQRRLERLVGLFPVA